MPTKKQTETQEHHKLTAPDEERLGMEEERRRALYQYVHQLTPLQKDVLILRYSLGIKPAIIAQLLELSQTTVHTYLNDARCALQVLLAPEAEAEL